MISIIVAPPSWLCPPTIATTTIGTLSDKVKQLHGDSMTRRSHKIIDNHMAPAGCRTHRHASREELQNMIIAYIITNHRFGHITSPTLQKKVRRPLLCLYNFYVASMGHEIEPF